MKKRLDQLVFAKGLVSSRSQAESWIRLSKVTVDGRVVTKPGAAVNDTSTIELLAEEQYVSRAGLKLASVAQVLKLDFRDKCMLDVGSSTGGFTDYALRQGARKVIAVDVGTDQLHPTLRGNDKIELHEQTDIRALRRTGPGQSAQPGHVALVERLDLVVIDVSFISLREILPHIATLCDPQTVVAAMVKPQFEARESNLKHKGVIKNDRMRREILKDFEQWVTKHFVVLDKADSDVAGSKGNLERFYKLRKTVKI